MRPWYSDHQQMESMDGRAVCDRKAPAATENAAEASIISAPKLTVGQYIDCIIM